jgi:AcrR family transcriptional regulator
MLSLAKVHFASRKKRIIVARPIQANAQETQRRILAAAHSLFSLHGEGSTSMRQIAKESDVSLATVHHYFVNKEGLYQAACDVMYERLATLQDTLEPALLTAKGPKEILTTAISVTYQFVLEHQQEARFMMRHVVDTGEIQSEKRAAFLLPFLDSASRILSSLTQISTEKARLNILSLNHLVVRFALTGPSELVMVAGLDETGQDASDLFHDAKVRIEEHMIELAYQMFKLD